jgi:hypothetical protein
LITRVHVALQLVLGKTAFDIASGKGDPRHESKKERPHPR